MYTKEQIENNIFHGSCLEELKKFPDECLDCCVSSPPYFGLRNYHTEYSIWPSLEGIANNYSCPHTRWNPIKAGQNTSWFCDDGCGHWKGELGMEPSPELFVDHLTLIFREVRRAMKPHGTLWVNLGDTYYGKDFPKRDDLKPKDLVGAPWMMAKAFQKDGWYLRNDNIWYKPTAMPENVLDRCSRNHEYMFFFTKSEKCYFDMDSVREKQKTVTGWSVKENHRADGGINHGTRTEANPLGKIKRTVWEGIVPVSSKNIFKDKQVYGNVDYHSAIYPELLIEPCIKAGCPEGGIVFDPFMGSATTAVVALKHKRKYSGTELNKDYLKLQKERISQIDLDKIHGNNSLKELIEC